jgi:demethylmenaquinone methyltransferase/2-methoxy-6-polyprenyl-1,4-benzoquinol methylase
MSDAEKIPVQTPDPAWADDQLKNPHAQPDKARRVRDMFAAIAPSYDLNNRLHSFGRDQAWRRSAVKLAGLAAGDQVADIACGTGDLTLAFADALGKLGGQKGPVLGIDFTFEMLPLANRKGGDSGAVRFVQGDAMNLPLPNDSVDVVSIAFGLRNVAEPSAALREFYRVLKPGGRLIVLEFTVPTNLLMRLGYDLYCGQIMPRTASWIARDKSGAYRYLPRSVNTFADRDTVLANLADAGFAETRFRGLTFGIAACYRGLKLH